MTVTSRLPLRVKLVAVVLVLAAAGLTAAGVATSAALRSYLLERKDSQLAATSHGVVERLTHGQPAVGDDGPRDRLGLPNDYFVRLSDGSGKRLGDTGAMLAEPDTAPRLPPLDTASVQARGREPFTVPAAEGGGRWRVVVTPLGSTATVAVAVWLGDVTSTLDRLTMLELLIGAAVLLVVGVVGYLVVRSSLRPLVEVETTAEAIAAGDLTRRVPSGDRRTEVGRLSAALNAMLGHIEAAFRSREDSEREARESENRMRRFVADASHELRTPLTSIRGFAELYRQGAVRSPGELARAMGRIENEAARMGLLVDDLLLLARLDQQRPLERKPVDLLTLAADAVHDARAVAPDRSVELVVDGGSQALVVVGDEQRLRQVLANLVSNALTHTPAGTPVVVRVRTVTDEAAALVEVTDKGPGLAPDDAARVFERFWRSDPSRARAGGGSGLGLSIVKALVVAHGGTVGVDSRPGEGSTFWVRLPLSP